MSQGLQRPASEAERGVVSTVQSRFEGVRRSERTDKPAVTIRADQVPAVLSTLEHEGGFDHCSNVVAQERPDRFETIYFLTSYAERDRELAVIVPTGPTAPVSDSAVPAFETANWHEREAYDLLGIEYRDHPNLERILLPETWQGHPLREDYNQRKPQIVTFEENDDPLDADATGPDGTDVMMVNIGPHHPATHGVLHLKTVLDGEQVADVEPELGYIHRCEEQLCEQSTYRHQIMPYPDRWDWSGAGLLSEWAYARCIETLADIEVPDYAQLVRTMSAELSRMLSHLLALGTFALDVIGDFTATFMYTVKDRERIQSILEDLTGQRLMFNYFRVGGVVWDLPEPREAFFEKVRRFVAEIPDRIDEYHDLLTNNEIIQLRTIDKGVLPTDTAKSYGVTGPVARGSGIDYDLRRDDAYGYYDALDWDVVTRSAGDNYARLLVRMREVEESAKIVRQTIDRLEDWPADDREVQANVPRTLQPTGECYQAVESAKGELGIYIRGDGTDTPARFKIRAPSFSNLAALPEMARGEFLSDLIATLGSLDPVMGEVDR